MGHTWEQLFADPPPKPRPCYCRGCSEAYEHAVRPSRPGCWEVWQCDRFGVSYFTVAAGGGLFAVGAMACERARA